MNGKIRKMVEADRECVAQMMKAFYASDAVFTNGSDEIFSADIDACVGDNPFAEGFVIEREGEILGYSMIAKSFSTEFGKPCIWIEDIYIKSEFRGVGFGDMLMSFITTNYSDCIFRLEVEEENKRAVELYKKHGFGTMPYLEMKK